MERSIPVSLVVPSRIVFAAWLPAVLIACAYLLAGHLLPLPAPGTTDPRLTAEMAIVRGEAGRGQWVAMHVLSSECGCSRRVMCHLMDRGARHGMVERIVMVGHDDAAATHAAARGYGYVEVTAERLASEYHVEVAPLLVVADPTGAIRYLGGYTDRKQGADILDASIMSRLAAGTAVRALPTFGCAVSNALRARVDPLGLR